MPVGRAWRHENDTMVCMDLLNRGLSNLQSPNLFRCLEVFQAVRFKVYKDSPGARPSQVYNVITPSADGSYGAMETQDFDAGMNLWSLPGDSIESYLDQVNDFLGGGVFDVDETLNGWYTALMQEVQQ